MTNQRGLALLLAMFTISLVSFLAMELSYQTNVEYIVNSQAIQRLKAHYAAKAGMDLSLMRIKVYTQVQAQYAQMLGNQAKILDMIWSMPFAWPPVLPENLNSVDKDLINDKIKESTMDSGYVTTISDEGSKIDLNDLNSPSKALRDLTKKRLLQIFEVKKRDDEQWARDNPDLRPEEIVNSIADWVTPGRSSLNGGDKRAQFAGIGEGLPPNRAFRAVSELKLIPGITEDIYRLLEDQVTPYGMKAINPNHASKEVLMSLDVSITSEVADKLIARRSDDNQGGQFKDANDFWAFVQASGGRVDPEIQQNLPLVFNTVFNFKIKSIGNFKSATREITAIVFDLNKSAEQVTKQLKKENPPPNPPGGSGSGGNQPTNSANNNKTVSKGPPRIVYWNEK